jgi:hypothetical protein
MSKKESAAQHFFGRHGIAEFRWEEGKSSDSMGEGRKKT